MKYFLATILLFTSTVQAGNVRTEMLQLINRARTNAKLPALTYDWQLEKSAQGHSAWMSRTGKMIHLQGKKPQSKDRSVWEKSSWHPVNRAVKAGYIGIDVLSKDANSYIGENIAHGNPQSGPGRYSSRVIFSGWMKSLGHKKAILGKYKHLGVGVTIKNGHVWWCAVFGKK